MLNSVVDPGFPSRKGGRQALSWDKNLKEKLDPEGGRCVADVNMDEAT